METNTDNKQIELEITVDSKPDDQLHQVLADMVANQAEDWSGPDSDDILEYMIRDLVFSDALALEAIAQCWLFEQVTAQEMDQLYNGSRVSGKKILNRLSRLFITVLVNAPNMKHRISYEALKTWTERMLAETVMWAKGNGISLEHPSEMGKEFFARYYGTEEFFFQTHFQIEAANVTALLDSFAGKVFWLEVMGPDAEEFQDLIRFGKNGPHYRQLTDFIMDYPLPFRAFEPLVDNVTELLCRKLEGASLEHVISRQEELVGEYSSRFETSLEERVRRGLSAMEIRAILEKRLHTSIAEYLPEADKIEEWFGEQSQSSS